MDYKKKYIDADPLKKEIKRLKDEYTDIAIDSQRGWVNANSVIDDLEQLQSHIDSLQQEQPAKRGYKDCNGCEYNRLLKDQIGWQFRGCFGGDYKGKPIAEIELCPLKVAQQEQPSEELEEAAEKSADEEYPQEDKWRQRNGYREAYKQGWLDRDAQVPRWRVFKELASNESRNPMALVGHEDDYEIVHSLEQGDRYLLFKDLEKLPKEV